MVLPGVSLSPADAIRVIKKVTRKSKKKNKRRVTLKFAPEMIYVHDMMDQVTPDFSSTVATSLSFCLSLHVLECHRPV